MSMHGSDPAANIAWFDALRVGDVALVGGKNASLGELYAAMAAQGIKVPNGFAVTSHAYRAVLQEAGAWNPLHELLDDLDKSDVKRLAQCAAAARKIVYDAARNSKWLREDVVEAYRKLEREYEKGVAVAVRSSATAEDLPTASFAGQHDSLLHICGAADVFEACCRCMASIFTDRAIAYRIDNGFDHFKVYLSVGVMKMVRSDRACSGVMFTLDTESGFRDVVFITGSYGIGENIVQGRVDPDEFYVHKPTFLKGYRSVLRRSLGGKQKRMIYARGHIGSSTRSVATKAVDRGRFCLTDEEVLALADCAIKIEAHYSNAAGHAMPMDIEWAKDGLDGQLYIVQARPETVASQRPASGSETYALTGKGKVLATGRAVGERIGHGIARVVHDPHDLASFRPGDVLVADTTSPDWEPIMKTAAAIVTNTGGRTCHAAIIARELGVPAIVGAARATTLVPSGTSVTICCAEGDIGTVYEGAVPFEVTRLPADDRPRPHTRVMVNLGNPDLAFRSALLPNDGVGLARMEFIISEHIGIHPMALVHPDRVASKKARDGIARLTRNYAPISDYFVERLAEGVGMIAAAFYPRPVIVRLSDFKTNEYANLIGGAAFETKEANPMLGFRGASRYAHPAYAEGFALECAALKRVREDMGLTNLVVMIPFCRRIDEARKVIDAMAGHGLIRGRNGLEIYVMCEIPNNVIQIDAFSALFDGFSIGSNDLTQLTLGVDRDSEIVAFDFDERDAGMLEMFRQTIAGAHRNGRHVGICGEAPANYPELTRLLTNLGIDSISVNPTSLFRTTETVRAAEAVRTAA